VSGIVFSGEVKFTKLLNDELNLLEQMKSLTEEQARYIEMDEFDELVKLLDNRQKLIEKIDGLHQETDPLMQSYISSADYGTILQIENLREKIKKTLTLCKEQNDRNVETLRQKSEEHAEKIEKQSAKRKVIGGYAQAAPTSSMRFDKKT